LTAGAGHASALVAGATLAGGSGVDRAVFYDAPAVTAAMLSRVSGVETLDLRLPTTSVALTGAFVAAQGGTVTLDADAAVVTVMTDGPSFGGAIAVEGMSRFVFTGGGQSIHLTERTAGSVDAGDGDDVVVGGVRNDVVTLGSGADRFVHGPGGGDDRLVDFDPNQDRLVLRDAYNAASPETAIVLQSGADAVVYAGDDRIRVSNVSAEALRGAIAVERTSGLTWSTMLTTSTDRFYGDDGDDVVSTYVTALGAADVIDMGAGEDRLVVLSRPAAHLDLRGYQNIDGLDVIDVSGKDWARVILDDAVLSGTDAGVLKVEAGATDLYRLDLAGVSSAYRVELSGSGATQLGDGGQSLYLEADYTGALTGGAGADSILVRGAAATLSLGDGADAVKLLASSLVQADLGAGDDSFDVGGSALLAGSALHGGAGFDTLTLRATSTDLTSLSAFTGFERLEIRAEGASVLLPTLSGPIVIDGSDGNRVGVTTAADAEVVVGRRVGKLTLSGGAQTVTAEAGADLDLYAGDGADLIQGGSGADAVRGEAGDDVIDGGAGDDALWGGLGRDRFVYRAGEGSDIVADFDPSQDVLEIHDIASARTALELSIRTNGANAIVDVTGADGMATTISVVDVTASALRAAIEIVRAPDLALDVQTTSGADRFYGGAGADMVSAYISTLGASDRLDLGAGEDTLKILSGSFTLDFAQIGPVNGLDVIDVSAASVARVFLDDDVVRASDHGVVTIRMGAAGIERLSTAPVGDAGQVITEGSGVVRLANGGHFVDQAGSGAVIGGSGDDVIRRIGPGGLLEGGDGDDVLIGGQGADLLSGGDGADRVVFKVGGGHDEIQDFAVGVDRAQLSGFGVTSFAELAGMMAQTANGVAIALPGGDDVLTLKGVDLAHLSVGDFLF
ncbi:MAG: calcium-binding protein, partial [Alphaproteobacteria bacterium]